MLLKMPSQSDWIRTIKQVLDLLPRKTVRRGRGYFRDGHVLELNCIDPECHYRAIVRGGEDYQVDLDFQEEPEINCSCPVGLDCKHGVAALLKLQEQLENGFPNVSATPPATALRPLRKPNSTGAPHPPPSPLSDKLIEKLGRKLDYDEAAFVRQVQACWSRSQHARMTENDLMMMSGTNRAASYVYWKEIALWSQRPRDEYYFWLHVAWELRRRKIDWPDFMDAITDLQLIEPAMQQWEREKEVERWKNWFGAINLSSAPASEPAILDLRLVVSEHEARLQWRLNPNTDFAEFKQSQAKKFASQFENGSLALTPDSLPLWSSAYKPWAYHGWWIFRYHDSTAVPVLARLFKMPLAPDHIVGPDAKPFPRNQSPLRLHLEPPEENGGDYRLTLKTAEGETPPRILCVLQQNPALYVTEQGLFHGPPPSALEMDLQRDIPAAALETTEGVRFLNGCGVALPPVLQQRVISIPVTVTVTCTLHPVYSGSASEDIVIEVTAAAPNMHREKLSPGGWAPDVTSPARPAKNDTASSILVHDRSIQSRLPQLLETLGAKWQGYPGDWKVRLTKKLPEVFALWLKSLPQEIEVRLSKELATLRDEPISGSVAFDIAEAGIDWFDIRIKLDIGDTALTPEEIKLLLNARGGYVRLGKKGWRRLQYNLSPDEDEQLARLGLHARDFSAEPQRFHALQLADEAAKKFLGPERAELIRRRAGELKTRVTPPQPESILATLRPYQTEGFHFLAYLTANRFGGVLADDMGLGKTLQTLAWLAWLRESPPAVSLKSSLAVCPKSVMDNWRAEAERFYPTLRVRLWRGEPAAELDAARAATDLLVINYSQLRALSPEIARSPWLALILDEAQYIKNPDSQTAQAARALQSEHRLALTGTPIENRLLDLWSIFSFAMPGVIGNRSHFLRRFDAKDDPLARRRLAARVRPFLLRRTKTQVAKDLPDRVEEDLFCEMEAEQKTLYRAELKRARQTVLGLKTARQLNEQRFNILTSLLRLRQICCHPALIDNGLRHADAAKISALEDLLEPLMAEGHKVLVFSQFVTMLDILRDTVNQRGWPHFYLAGDTENRGELVHRFQSAKGGAVFLISLKAGGFGLNLTAASYVVLFDPWWNPAVENQAIDRTHRIGQTRKVMAYRLLMRDSVEQKIRLLQKQKAFLAEDVLGEERFSQSLTLDDLRFLFAE